MIHLINKSALVAEIERRMDFHHKRGNQNDSCVEDVLYGILSYINTLEVKEVDLEKPFEGIKVQTSMESGSLDEIIVTTKYKAQKGE